MRITKVTPIMEIQAYNQALKEKQLEDKLNHLYAAADVDPDNWEVEEEIAELEQRLKRLQDNRPSDYNEYNKSYDEHRN